MYHEVHGDPIAPMSLVAGNACTHADTYAALLPQWECLFIATDVGSSDVLPGLACNVGRCCVGVLQVQSYCMHGCSAAEAVDWHLAEAVDWHLAVCIVMCVRACA